MEIPLVVRTLLFTIRIIWFIEYYKQLKQKIKNRKPNFEQMVRVRMLRLEFMDDKIKNLSIGKSFYLELKPIISCIFIIERDVATAISYWKDHYFLLRPRYLVV